MRWGRRRQSRSTLSAIRIRVSSCHPSPAITYFLERARGKCLRFLSVCIHSADCRGLTVNEVWCVRPSLARRLESRKSLLECTLKWSIRSIHTQFNERTPLLIQFISIYNPKTQDCYRMYTKGEGIW